MKKKLTAALCCGIIFFTAATPVFATEVDNPKEQIKIAQSVRQGAYGRWYIPDVGIDVAAYPSSEQSVVDKQDSAAYYWYYKLNVVCDHNGQGYAGIMQCKPGMKACMKTETSVKNYICLSVFEATNTGTNLIDKNGIDISDYMYIDKDCILCYTCKADDPKEIVCAIFMRLKE